MRELRELYRKRDIMFHQVGLLLEDYGTILEIGDKTFIEYEQEVLKPAIDMFGFINKNTNEVWKYRGHTLALIKFYCDTFNTKGDGSER